jgi:hypothetical protein
MKTPTEVIADAIHDERPDVDSEAIADRVRDFLDDAGYVILAKTANNEVPVPRGLASAALGVFEVESMDDEWKELYDLLYPQGRP